MEGSLTKQLRCGKINFLEFFLASTLSPLQITQCQKNLVRLNRCVSDFLITKAAAKAENVFCAGKVVDCPSNSFFKGEKASHDPSDLKIKSRFPFHVLYHFWNPDNIGHAIQYLSKPSGHL